MEARLHVCLNSLEVQHHKFLTSLKGQPSVHVGWLQYCTTSWHTSGRNPLMLGITGLVVHEA
jgi:hypothetical protein